MSKETFRIFMLTAISAELARQTREDGSSQFQYEFWVERTYSLQQQLSFLLQAKRFYA